MQLRIWSIALAILGEAFLVFLFFYLLPPYLLGDNIRILDFTVTSVIYLIILFNFLRPFVRIDGRGDGSHKEVAGLGIRWTACGWYSALALLFALGNILYTLSNGEEPLAFKWQLSIQILLFILFLWGIFASQTSQAHAKKVYQQEQSKKEGKKEIKEALSHLGYYAESTPGLSSDIVKRIGYMTKEARYITPSDSSEAQATDMRIVDLCSALENALTDYEINENSAGHILRQLEVELKHRKKL